MAKSIKYPEHLRKALEKLKERQRDMEMAILEVASGEIKRFMDETGCPVTSITIDVKEVESGIMGKPSSSVLHVRSDIKDT